MKVERNFFLHLPLFPSLLFFFSTPSAVTLAKGRREGDSVTIILLEFLPDVTLVSVISPLAPLLQAQAAALGPEPLHLTSSWLLGSCSGYIPAQSSHTPLPEHPWALVSGPLCLPVTKSPHGLQILKGGPHLFAGSSPPSPRCPTCTRVRAVPQTFLQALPGTCLGTGLCTITWAPSPLLPGSWLRSLHPLCQDTYWFG